MSYTLSGGAIIVPQGGGSGNGIWLGADSNQLGTTTFTLSGSGKALVYNVKGGQSASSGANQIFNFSGGTLAAYSIDMSNLQSSNAPGSYGTLYNNGGILAPGDIGTAGKTTITGNYTNASGATLAIDIGGTTVAGAFQDTAGKYDRLTVSLACALNGSLNVSLINGFNPLPGQTFTIVTAGSTSGLFTNLDINQRVTCTDSTRSFHVTTNATSVVLDTYQSTGIPSVAATPISTNITYGKSIVLSANATGGGTLAYQWYDNNTNPISGATASSVTLSPAVAASGNYTVIVTNSFGSATSQVSVAVSPMNLTVTANNDAKSFGQTKTYGAGSTAFTSSGLQNGETIGSVTITATNTPNNGTAATDPVGNYTLTPSAATGGTFNLANYNIAYVNGTLTVTQAVPTLTLVSSANPAGYQANLTFTANLPGYATGTVIFETNNTAYVTNSLSGGTTNFSLSTLPRGTNLITAIYSGDSNYLPATRIL